MNTPQFKIPSFNAVQGPAFGLYAPAGGELGVTLGQVIAAIKSGQDQHLPVPGIPGFFCTGKMFGSSLRLAVAKHEDAAGECLDLPIGICTTYIALDGRDLETLGLDAIAAARAHLPDAVNPSFTYAMQHEPSVPFTAVIPHGGIVEAEKHGLLTLQEVSMCTGFFQTIIGEICADSDLIDRKALVAREQSMAQEIDDFTLDARAITGAIQTGGTPADTLIVESGPDGYPEVYAYIVDAELDVFRVDFTPDTMTFDTEGMSYMMMETWMLDLIRDLRAEADVVFEEIDEIAMEIDAEDEDCAGSDEEDPFWEVYTRNHRIEVPSAMAQRMAKGLCLSLRYAEGATDPAQADAKRLAGIG